MAFPPCLLSCVRLMDIVFPDLDAFFALLSFPLYNDGNAVIVPRNSEYEPMPRKVSVSLVLRYQLTSEYHFFDLPVISRHFVNIGPAMFLHSRIECV